MNYSKEGDSREFYIIEKNELKLGIIDARKYEKQKFGKIKFRIRFNRKGKRPYLRRKFNHFKEGVANEKDPI